MRPLADEINGLLAHNAEVVERARTQAGNLAHALKNPLAVLRNEASAAEGELAETVLSRGSEMQRQIDRHLARARAAGRSGLSGTRCDPAPILARLLRTLEQLHGQRGLAVDLRCDEGAAFAGETGDLEEMLGNLLDNAFKWAAGEIRVTAEIRDGRLLVTIDDDGPGLPEAERRTALRRGGRLDEAVPGSGLGLAIVGDIAELYGGELSLEEAPSGGLRARLTLPSAA